MNVVYKGMKEYVVEVEGNAATPVREGVVGQALVEFYNYFDKYRFKHGQLLFCDDSGKRLSDIEIGRIILDYPLSTKLSMTENEIQLAFTSLNLDVPAIGRMDTLADKFRAALLLSEEDNTKESVYFDFRQTRFTSFFALLDDEPVMVYEVKDITNYITLEFYHAFFGPEPRRIGICPICGTMFLLGRGDNTYCTRQCFTEANNRRNRSNPYHVKYRSLQQRYNKIIHDREDSPEYALLCRCYEAWQPWAKAQYDEVNKVYQTIPSAEERLLREVFPDERGEYVAPDMIAPEDFAAKLKAKWEELKQTA